MFSVKATNRIRYLSHDLADLVQYPGPWVTCSVVHVDLAHIRADVVEDEACNFGSQLSKALLDIAGVWERPESCSHESKH